MKSSNKECEGSILAFWLSEERGSMSKEIIQHNNKKITKITKQNGDISYSLKGVYIGTDVKTGKRITKTINC